MMHDNLAPHYGSQKPKNRFDFGKALHVLKVGYAVTREGWNGKGMYLFLLNPSESTRTTLPCIFIKTADDEVVPWTASQTDILAEDWRWA